MKVLFVGDTHGKIGAIKLAMREAKRLECDTIFQVGDFGYWEHAAEGVLFIQQVNDLIHKYAIPIYFLDGNHDKTSLLLEKYTDVDGDGFIELGPGLKYSPRGHRWTWDGLRFVSFGGAYSVDKDWRLGLEKKQAGKIFEKNLYRPKDRKVSTDTSGTIWFPEEEMSDNDMDGFLLADSSPVNIMLTHDKPRASSPRWNRKDYPECWPNQDRLQRALLALKPEILIHGHLHYSYVDQVLCGDNYQYTTVMGLNADGERGSMHPIDLKNYRKALDEDNQDSFW